MTTVYVAAAITPESSGAFEWSWTRDRTVSDLERIAAPGDDTCVRAIDIPAAALAPAITDYLDRNPELWEPREGERAGAEE